MLLYFTSANLVYSMDSRTAHRPVKQEWWSEAHVQIVPSSRLLRKPHCLSASEQFLSIHPVSESSVCADNSPAPESSTNDKPKLKFSNITLKRTSKTSIKISPHFSTQHNLHKAQQAFSVACPVAHWCGVLCQTIQNIKMLAGTLSDDKWRCFCDMLHK